VGKQPDRREVISPVFVHHQGRKSKCPRLQERGRWGGMFHSSRFYRGGERRGEEAKRKMNDWVEKKGKLR